MTLFLLDVASWQGSLAPADVKRAGFGAVNLKVSHGLTRKSVHPDVTGWVDACRTLGLGVCTFHYLDGPATGAAQAAYCHDRIAELGLTAGTAHQVDCESTATEAILRDYLTTMRGLLGRPVTVYTGDWWWKPRGWDVSDLTPYLWAAPNAGYLTAYPGDNSAHWTAGYGGWPALSVMQYAVKPLIFPDNTAGMIDVSKSAIRDPTVWTALTGGDMTFAPDSIIAVRDLVHEALPEIPLVSLGIVGDDNHAQTGSSYHLGKSALRPDSYTIVESSRDRNGLTEAASALDFGWWQRTVGGRVHNLRTYSTWLVAQCKAGTPDTADLREVIYSPDGVVVKRWDRLGVRDTGDNTHLTHTHHSWFRDSEKHDKTALFRRYFTEIGLIQEDLVTTQAEFNTFMTTWAKSTEGVGLGVRGFYEVLALIADAAGGRDGTAQPVTPTGRQMRNNWTKANTQILAPQNVAHDQILTAVQSGTAEDAARDQAAAAAVGVAVTELQALRQTIEQAGGDPDLAPVMQRLDAMGDLIATAGQMAGQQAAAAVLSRIAAGQEAGAAALRDGT